MPPDAPAFSVVVPVYRQWEHLPRLLAALAAQADAPGFELILVDNEPEAAAPRPEAPPGLALRILACARPGSYAARNLGAAAARGRWLVFTDADCRPAPRWLAALAAGVDPGSLLAGPVEVVGGEPPNPCEIYDMIRGIPQARYVARGYAATANLAVPRAVFEALGGFDPRRLSGGDAEFCRRAGAAGHPLRLVAGALTRHPARADWAELAAKERRIKGGQIGAGPLPRRIAWTFRTLLPPLGDTRAYLAAPAPWRWRAVAVGIRFRLWGVDLTEMLRLLAGGRPRR
ncbi:glycosyltransferase family 2 protein [Amaricoccus solimangrovi]|uniref:Glycosyltransferase n=1 Tax=Amaricoccus solimangrovi TaxID=2589815 RepID=A0A501WJW2_9RHOB|nr:glycosyltransferase [Amaricoccus solimangrovi]TPE48394.1 glycosyltransferase [Amaricoccus solimangrovi]